MEPGCGPGCARFHYVLFPLLCHGSVHSKGGWILEMGCFFCGLQHGFRLYLGRERLPDRENILFTLRFLRPNSFRGCKLLTIGTKPG